LNNGGGAVAYTGSGAATVPGALPTADGSTPVNYTITGAVPGSLLTITTDVGTLNTTDGTGGERYTGIQVLVDINGEATFSIIPPYSTAASPAASTITVTDTTGAAFGDFTQNYVPTTPPAGPPPAIAQRFDFNSGASPTRADFTGVLPTDLYSTTTGYGWATAVQGYDRGTAPTVADLYRDGAWGYGSNGVFRIGVTPGAQRDVRLYFGDPYDAWPGVTVSIEGNPTPVTIDPVVDRYGFVTLRGTDSGDGALDLTIHTNLGGIWVASGLDVATPGNLPAPVKPLGTAQSSLKAQFADNTPPVEPGYTSVLGTGTYTPGTGYGWTSAVNLFERDPAQYPASTPFSSRGAWGQGSSTFAIAVNYFTPATTYSLRAYLSDPYYNWNGITVSAEGSTTSTVSSNFATPTTVDFANVRDLNGDGLVTFTISAPIWVLNGLEFATVA
jgi:hypothetical protein